MAANGVKRGDRIAYLGASSIAGFEVFFAVGRLGAIYLPLNTRLSVPDTIREALALKLASYKIPKYVQHVPNLPKTATGKVRKRDLSQLIKETADDHHR